VGGQTSTLNYQIAPLWAFDSNHALRASYSVAHTVPSLFTVDSKQATAPHVQFEPNGDLLPQQVRNSEIGYRGHLFSRRVGFDTSLYYTVVRNISTAVPELVGSDLFIQFRNRDAAIARGVESELTYRLNSRHSVYLNYTGENISDEQAASASVTRATPVHKVNFGGIVRPWARVTASANVGYKTGYQLVSDSRGTVVAAPAYWRVDARVAVAASKNTDFYVAGQNLTRPTHVEFADGLAVTRTVQAGVTIRVGGSR
jgi:outer membrane receptor protein involved in Fe transport